MQRVNFAPCAQTLYIYTLCVFLVYSLVLCKFNAEENLVVVVVVVDGTYFSIYIPIKNESVYYIYYAVGANEGGWEID